MSLKDIASEVVDSGGVKTYKMDVIRDAAGAGRLGVHVRTKISTDLAAEGIRHWPADLPDSQLASVRLYKIGTSAGNLIEAVLTVDPSKDETIMESVDNGAQAMLDEIRSIVGA